MKKQITMYVTAPVECTDEQFEEWAEFNLGSRADMSTSNPLSDYDLTTDDVTIYD